ncbi:MAG: PRC-barrel domain-containing protein [Phycisphaerales bacterium]|nr:PRC-barrel domain-containing protein [Planctomycetota bacterium]MCH8509764.1 PRC-barrel domain-containing protein [Phycisphaerales bacterium]
MTRNAITGITALTIALSAGTAFAQARTQPADRTQTQRAQAERQELRMHKASDLKSLDLKNRNGENLGRFDDFIVERGTGSIAFAIVRTGGVLGMGGTQVAIPYTQLAWSDAEDTFVADMTEEQMKNQAEFLPENWNDLHHTTWMERIRGWVGLDDQGEYDREATKAFKDAEKKEISGTIVAVEREGRVTESERIVIEVQTRDGEREKVVLGPAWYVMSHHAAPMRGENITIKAFKHDDKLVAISAGDRGSEMTLRDREGKPAWGTDRDRTDQDRRDQADPDRRDRTDQDRRDRTQQDRRDRADQDRRQQTEQDRRAGTDQDRRTHAPRYVLLSDLIGANAEARGISSGKIDDAIVERRSGKIAFLAFNPNENFLGIGDRISIVPFTVARIDRELTVNIDADQQILSNAMAMPDNVERLQSENTLNAAYRPFDTRPVQFRPAEARTEGARTQIRTDRP